MTRCEGILVVGRARRDDEQWPTPREEEQRSRRAKRTRRFMSPRSVFEPDTTTWARGAEPRVTIPAVPQDGTSAAYKYELAHPAGRMLRDPRSQASIARRCHVGQVSFLHACFCRVG